MKNDASEVVTSTQVDSGHSADALAVEDDVLRRYRVAFVQGRPGSVDVRVEVLLQRLPGARTVARVVVAEDVAVDPHAEHDVEAADHAQVDGVGVGEEERVLGVRAALDVHARDLVPSARARVERVQALLLHVAELPLGALGEVERVLVLLLVDGGQRVRRLRRAEGHLGGDGRWAWWATEQATQLAYAHAVHVFLTFHPGSGQLCSVLGNDSV